MNQNPFSLMFGKKPFESVPRVDQSERVIRAFESAYSSEQIFMITGIRGSGKTVFMSELASYFKSQDEWTVIDLNAASDLLDDLAIKLSNSSKLRSFLENISLGVSLPGLDINIGNRQKSSSSELIIANILESMLHHKKRLLVTIDDVSNSKSMQQFAAAFQSFIRQDYPIYLLMTGLYEKIDELQNMDNLTFLHRAEKIFMTPLNRRIMASTYKTIFDLDETESYRMADLTLGYSYAFQVLGYFTWENKGDSQAIMQNYRTYLYAYVYDKVWTELSGKDKELLHGMALIQSHKVKDIRDAVKMTSGTFNQYRRRLLNKGLVVSNEYGQLAFAMPLFNEYVLENTFEEE